MTIQTEYSHRQTRLPIWLGACLFGAIALFFLLGEHKVHILGALPFLLLLACPVIHLFMHHGHNHGHGGGSSPTNAEDHTHHHGDAP